MANKMSNPYQKYIKTLECEVPFNKDTTLVNYWIVKSDSLGNINRFASGSYNNMKEKYLEHKFTPLDGYYIVEVESKICRVVK